MAKRKLWEDTIKKTSSKEMLKKSLDLLYAEKKYEDLTKEVDKKKKEWNHLKWFYKTEINPPSLKPNRRKQIIDKYRKKRGKNN